MGFLRSTWDLVTTWDLVSASTRSYMVPPAGDCDGAPYRGSRTEERYSVLRNLMSFGASGGS